ncbi:PD-(D/E)XK nuclease-like domain-containing protein [Akkermansia glycaniphila]|uniref:PD-(D/E)XK nuclease-like domain-containing protein n=1 Tax=Akkermansia glycaniphila TaxID=1679444 RepID=UPI001C01E660|nr:PD-(D/E)XK nuclease-like domain-containing protein [Akkermansia glycaniphila]MBT9449976.1 PD-(D/E)XK nuclease-like domain-containing protein [Akkermansia glycaniphila]
MNPILQQIRNGGWCGKINPEDYHALKGETVVSKSTLWEYMASPYNFRQNQLAGVKKESSGFAWGNLIDCLFLTPALLDSQYVIEKKLSGATKAGKEQAERISMTGKQLLDPDVYMEAIKAERLLREHVEMYGIERFETQIGMGMQVVIDIDGTPVSLSVLGLLDMRPEELGVLRDLKTTRLDISNERALMYAITDFGYHVQAAMYLDLWNILHPDDQRERFEFIFQESRPHYRVRTVELEPEAIQKGREAYNKALRQYARSIALNDWPGAHLTIATLGLTYGEQAKDYTTEGGAA